MKNANFLSDYTLHKLRSHNPFSFSHHRYAAPGRDAVPRRPPLSRSGGREARPRGLGAPPRLEQLHQRRRHQQLPRPFFGRRGSRGLLLQLRVVRRRGGWRRRRQRLLVGRAELALQTGLRPFQEVLAEGRRLLAAGQLRGQVGSNRM